MSWELGVEDGMTKVALRRAFGGLSSLAPAGVTNLTQTAKGFRRQANVTSKAVVKPPATAQAKPMVVKTPQPPAPQVGPATITPTQMPAMQKLNEYNPREELVPIALGATIGGNLGMGHILHRMHKAKKAGKSSFKYNYWLAGGLPIAGAAAGMYAKRHKKKRDRTSGGEPRTGGEPMRPGEDMRMKEPQPGNQPLTFTNGKPHDF